MRLAAVIFTVFAIPLSFGSGASAQETFYSPGTLSHRDRVAAQAALVGQLAENHRRNRYPDAVAWQQVTVRQAAEPLSIRTTAEARIEAALRQPTKLKFVGTSLAAVIDYLKDLHGIEIQIDHWGLAQAGLGPDTPVTQNLKNVSLRSALRLMLGQMGLTYVVRDEVLLITTRERANTMPQTRIYRDPRPTTVHIQSTVLTPVYAVPVWVR